MIGVDSPLVLYVAPGVGLLVAGLALWARAARVRRARAWSVDVGRVASAHGWRGALALGAVAMCALVALAGPRFGRRVITTETKALNLVVAVDVSRSMLAEDEVPTRLARAQREARKLAHDLAGDRLGLVAFAGASFVLSPLTVDDGALALLLDGLDPDMLSAGGTELAGALDRGRELLLAGSGVADRVLVVFTDGESHDSIETATAAAARLGREGIHLVLVGVGGVDPVRIPLRDAGGTLTGFQLDLEANEVRTWRRDDVLSALADAAGGVVVPPALGDQARVVRELVDQYKRAPQATTTAAQDVSRAWIPMLIATLGLLAHTLTRRTAALAALTLLATTPAGAQTGTNRADRAWLAGDTTRAAQLYEDQVLRGRGGDTAWLNLGTVALALGDSLRARPTLERAALSLDPEVRYRALFNLGLLALRDAARDSTARSHHLEAARRHYREALLLRPGDADAKWNYEVTLARQPPPPPGGGAPPPDPGERPTPPDEAPGESGLTREQAEQILNSLLAEERQTQESVQRKLRQPRSARRGKNW